MPLNGATRIMEMQVACIQEQGCTGPATLPARLFGGTDEAVIEEPDAGGEQAAEPTPASVIIEGDQPAPEATKEPKPTREPRERKNRDAGNDSGS